VRWTDRILGVALGLILGAGTVVVFVFVYSEQTVDAPSISDEGQAARAGGDGPGSGPAHPRNGGPARLPPQTVRVIGGAPPPSGPAELHYRKGQPVRLRIVSDQPVSLQLLGYGPPFTAEADQPTVRRFKAAKAGSFPLVVVPSHIDVATITVR
jgi:hypothetical protein